MNILHVLPRVEPSKCGISDYAIELSRSMKKMYQVNSVFLCLSCNISDLDNEFEIPVEKINLKNIKSLYETLNKYNVIILHVSLYGFEKRGIPLWLANIWSNLYKTSRHPIMLSMFHELYASGPLSSSSFWLKPIQKYILKKIALNSDCIRTNRFQYMEWILHNTNCKKNFKSMPVFSNFGEGTYFEPFIKREHSMVMSVKNIHSFDSCDLVLKAALKCCKYFNINNLHIIGAKKVFVQIRNDVKIFNYDYMNKEDISNVISSCRAAYVAYNPAFLAKSTIFASYAAFGLAVFVHENKKLYDGLDYNNNILFNSCANIDLESIGQSLFKWYQDHNIYNNSVSYFRQINELLYI